MIKSIKLRLILLILILLIFRIILSNFILKEENIPDIILIIMYNLNIKKKLIINNETQLIFFFLESQIFFSSIFNLILKNFAVKSFTQKIKNICHIDNFFFQFFIFILIITILSISKVVFFQNFRRNNDIISKVIKDIWVHIIYIPLLHCIIRKVF